MVFVGTRLLRQVECPSGTEPELGIHGVLLHGQFLHCVHGQVVRAARGDVQGCAVQQLLVLATRGAADIQPSVGPHVERIAMGDIPILVDHSRVEQGEREGVARQHREVVQHHALHRGGHGRGVELH